MTNGPTWSNYVQLEVIFAPVLRFATLCWGTSFRQTGWWCWVLEVNCQSGSFGGRRAPLGKSTSISSDQSIACLACGYGDIHGRLALCIQPVSPVWRRSRKQSSQLALMMSWPASAASYGAEEWERKRMEGQRFEPFFSCSVANK